MTVDDPERDVDDVGRRGDILALGDLYSIEGDVIKLEGNSQVG